MGRRLLRRWRQPVVVAVAGLVALAATPAAAGEPRRRPADVVVSFAPGTSPAAQRRALVANGLEVVRRVPHLDVVRARPPGGGRGGGGNLAAEPAVAAVDAVARFTAASAPSAEPAPDDPGFASQWNLPLIEIPDAWAVTKGAGAVVAVLDTGVAFEGFGPYRRAPDLAGTTFVAGYDFVDGDDHPNDDIDPAAPHRGAHGTHVTGTIAQTTDNGLAQAGVAPDATIMPVRVLDRSGGGDDDRIAGTRPVPRRRPGPGPRRPGRRRPGPRGFPLPQRASPSRRPHPLRPPPSLPGNTATGWWPPTRASSPSATPGSRGPPATGGSTSPSCRWRAAEGTSRPAGGSCPAGGGVGPAAPLTRSRPPAAGRPAPAGASAGDRAAHRPAGSRRSNCASSVEPTMASVAARPPVMTLATSSK